MDYFLIIILGIVVLSVWNSSRDANERMRDAVDRLEREIEFLRSQLAALVKTKSSESAAAGVVVPAATTQAAVKAQAQAEASQVAHGVPPPTAAFAQAAAPKPVEPV
ncbi:MAG: hypothetical protein WBX19_02585, partial [Terracidiphilus sp.]